ncbi:MAG: trypsin-like peptidase domain-containing protein [Clostridia bacterium]|nr:trypsin-like peptidase domain-containing protein [Clostridia bacterium]
MNKNHMVKRFAAMTMALLLCTVSIVALGGSDTAAEPQFVLAAVSAEIAQDPDRPELSIKEIARMAGPSIVAITVESTVAYRNPFGRYGFGIDPFSPFGGDNRGEYRRSGAGSGIIISADGYILTNSHVVDRANEIKVILLDGAEYDAVLIGQEPANDVAVLKVDANDLTPALIGDSSLLEVGELAVAIGNPLGEVNGSVTAGIISALERSITIEGRAMSLLQTDAAINPGNSGGALLNCFGEVIGIVTAKTSSFSVEGIGYAIPVSNVKELVEDIVNTGGENLKALTNQGPMLGIMIRDVDAELAEQHNVPEGVYVIDVEPFSAAERAGVHRGDTIVSMAGQEIATIEDLNRVKLEMELGIPQPLVVLRRGETVELSVVLVDGEQPQA